MAGKMMIIIMITITIMTGIKSYTAKNKIYYFKAKRTYIYNWTLHAFKLKTFHLMIVGY